MLPTLIAIFPQKLLQREKELARNLELNTHHLVTSWDLYHTLKHIPVYPENAIVTAPFSESFFDRISPQRTCKEAGIAEAYCICSEWKKETNSESIEKVKEFVQQSLDTMINNKLQTMETDCMKVTLETLESVTYRFSVSNPDGDYLEPIYFFKVYFFGNPGKLRFQVVLKVTMDTSLSGDYKYGIVHGTYPPVFASTASVEYLRRLSTMNELESQATKPKGMESEYCVVRR
jgi:hypothetical protein